MSESQSSIIDYAVEICAWGRAVGESPLLTRHELKLFADLLPLVRETASALARTCATSEDSIAIGVLLTIAHTGVDYLRACRIGDVSESIRLRAALTEQATQGANALTEMHALARPHVHAELSPDNTLSMRGADGSVLAVISLPRDFRPLSVWASVNIEVFGKARP